MRSFSALLFFLLYLSTSLSVYSQTITPDYHNIGKSITYFVDKTARLSLNQVKELESKGKFLPGKKEILNFGNSSAAIWIKVDPQYTGRDQIYLIVDAPNIEHVECHLTGEDGNYKIVKSGSLCYTMPGVAVENNFVFKLPFNGNKLVKPTYLRLRTNNIMLVPLKLATADNLLKGKALKDRIEYIYVGVLIALLLFNLFLYFSLKDKTYLYYTLYVLTLSLYLMVYIRGYGFLFGEDLRIVFSRFPHVFLSLSVITSLIFCRKFLNLERTVPGMLKFYYFLGLCGIVLFFTSISGHKSLSASIAQLLTVTVSVVLWISGIIAYRRGHKPAKYYIIAWFFIWVTVGIVTFSLAGALEVKDFTMELVPIGSTLELLLLSFALGDRYKIIIETEQRVRDENLMLVQDQNQRLEELVQRRTKLLTSTIAELESSDAVKNKLFSIIAHDLRSPLNSLISILSLNDMNALTMEDIQHMLKENKKNIETIYNTLNNLLHWAKSQMSGITKDPSAFDLKLLIEELVLVYAPLMEKKHINLAISMEGSYPVFADEHQIRLILRNLIDNAIKFTPQYQQVELKLKHTVDAAEICISNTVADTEKINTDEMMKINSIQATYGTANEKGVGLGLHLCREYIRSNGGGDLYISLKEQIISFSFTVPEQKRTGVNIT